MNRSGFTVAELAIGISAAGVVALVSAMLFKAGIVTYNYTMRQNIAMSAAKKALNGDASRNGMLWSAHLAQSVQSLDASSLAVVSSASAVTNYYLSDTDLIQNGASGATLQAEDISALAVNYYNLDGSGLIVESTSAASATLITMLVTVKGPANSQKTYNFFSGAILRNH